MDNRILRDMRYALLSQYYEWKGFFVYRTQLVIWMAYSLVNLAYSYIAVAVIYGVSSGIAGWSYYQMLFLVSVSVIALNALSYLVEFGYINQLLRYGGIDPYLVKPYGKATILLSLTGNVSSISAVIGGFAIMAYSASNIGFSPATFVAFVVLMAFGLVTLVLFSLMLTLLAYHLLKSSETVYNLMSFMGQASKYPLSVYGVLGQLVFTIVLPLGLASYYPAQAFLSQINLLRFVEVIAVSGQSRSSALFCSTS